MLAPCHRDPAGLCAMGRCVPASARRRSMSARPHLLALVALVALAVESLGTPVAANGPRVRFVDDDGRVGTRGCGGAAHVPDTIQGAVDVSGPGDTIMVCPGAYPEQL